jgi:hypothetical protein
MYAYKYKPSHERVISTSGWWVMRLSCYPNETSGSWIGNHCLFVIYPFFLLSFPRPLVTCWSRTVTGWAYFHALLSNVGGCHFLYCTDGKRPHLLPSALSMHGWVICIEDSGFGSLSLSHGCLGPHCTPDMHLPTGITTCLEICVRGTPLLIGWLWVPYGSVTLSCWNWS